MFIAPFPIAWIALFIIFTGIFPKSAAEGSPLCAGLTDSGDVFYEKFDNRSALESYRRAYAHCPDYPVLMKMTRAYIDYGEDLASKASKKLFLAGLRYADTLQQHFPDSVQSYFLRAVAAGNLAQIGNAMESVRMARIAQIDAHKTITVDQRLPEAYVVLGVYDRRVALANPFQKAIARVLFGRLPKGTLEDSELMLKKALELSPDNVYANFELGRTYLAQKDTMNAAFLFKLMQGLPEKWHLDRKLKTQGLALSKELRNR